MAAVKQGFTPWNTIILSLLTLAYIIGEIAHFLIGVVTRDMARDIHYGSMKCYDNETLSHNDSLTKCTDLDNEDDCSSAIDYDGINYCVWDYSGQGMEYQIIAGTIFVIIFTVTGVIMGFLADKVSRTKLSSVCIILFSVCGTVMAFATEYWHLVVLRMGIAAGEAAMRPIGGSLLAELFDPSTRGVANGIFSWGVYIGYGLTFVIGNYVPDADILGTGWRAAHVLGCCWGIPIGIIIFFLRDPRDSEPQPKRLVEKPASEKAAELTEKEEEKASSLQYWKTILYSFLQPAMVLLFVAAAVRHTAGYAWSLNAQLFIDTYYPDENPGVWIACCSIFGGSFGVFFGGFFSDWAVKRLGLYSRLWILSACLLLATPFSVLLLTLDPPVDYVMLLIYYFFSETWFAILFTVIVEIVPSDVRAACIGIFLFFMNNIAGNLAIVVEPVKEIYDSYRIALYIFFSGFVAASAILFFIASLPLYFDHKKKIRELSGKN